MRELLRRSDANGADRLNDAYRRAISLPSRIKGVKELADTLKVLVAMEREAYGLNADTGESKRVPLSEAIAGFMSQMHESGAGRLKFVPRAKL